MNLHDIENARNKIVRLCRLILDGKLSFIEGSRSIWRLGPEARLPENDPDMTIFLGIDSETDALPVGQQRKLWARDALERLPPDIGRSEAWAKDHGQAACESLVRRFGGGPKEAQ